MQWKYKGYIIKVQGVFEDTIITTSDGLVVAKALDIESAKEMIREFLPTNKEVN